MLKDTNLASAQEMRKINSNHSRITVNAITISLEILLYTVNLVKNNILENSRITGPDVSVQRSNGTAYESRIQQLCTVKLIDTKIKDLIGHFIFDCLCQESLDIHNKFLVIGIICCTHEHLEQLSGCCGMFKVITDKVCHIKDIQCRIALVIPHILPEIEIAKHLSTLILITNKLNSCCFNLCGDFFDHIVESLAMHTLLLLVQNKIKNFFLTLCQILLVPNNSIMSTLDSFHCLAANNKGRTLGGVWATLNKISVLDSNVRNQSCTVSAIVLAKNNGNVLNNLVSTHTAGLTTKSCNFLSYFLGGNRQALNLSPFTIGCLVKDSFEVLIREHVEFVLTSLG